MAYRRKIPVVKEEPVIEVPVVEEEEVPVIETPITEINAVVEVVVEEPIIEVPVVEASVEISIPVTKVDNLIQESIARLRVKLENGTITDGEAAELYNLMLC